MKFSSECMFVSYKNIEKNGKDTTIANFSDGTDVLMFYDNNKVCSNLQFGSFCKIIVDCSTTGVLRLVSVLPLDIENKNENS